MPVIKENFSAAQTEQICEKFKFEILPGETIAAEYFPGAMQAATFINITIKNINSKSDFLSRFSGNVTQYNEDENSDEKNVYDVSIFDLDHPPKDYICNLSFAENSGVLSAKIHVTGYIPELKSIYELCNNPFQPFLSNWIFMICLGIEAALITSVIAHISICFIRKHILNNAC